MPDTGAPWNIPYVAPSDLVRGYPSDSEDLADAIALGLSAAGNAGIGSNVVQTVKTDTFTTSSTSFTNITGLSVTITPTSDTSKILLLVSLALSPAAVNSTASWQIDGGNAATAYLGTGGNNAVSHLNRFGSSAEAFSRSAANQVGVYLDDPATTSSVTYSVQVKTTAGTASVNKDSQTSGLRSASSIIAIEVAA
jgi:hypothetical protein